MEVDNTRISALAGDASEAGRVKVLRGVDEVWIVQNIQERRLQLTFNSFSNRNALHEARVNVEVIRTIERVDREVAKDARRRSGKNSALDLRTDEPTRRRIRDDGQGIEPNVLKEGGRVGHWGLRGARERAERIGGRLELWSEPKEGTEVQLLVPASIAYENLRDSYRMKLFRKAKSRARRS